MGSPEGALQRLAAERALIHALVAGQLSGDGQLVLQRRFTRRFSRKVDGDRGVSAALLGIAPLSAGPGDEGGDDGFERSAEVQQIALEAFTSFQREPRGWSRTRRPYDRARQAPSACTRPESVPVPAFEYVVCEDRAQTRAARKRGARQAGWTWFIGWLFHWPGCAAVKFLEDRARARGDTYALALLAFRRNVRDTAQTAEALRLVPGASEASYALRAPDADRPLAPGEALDRATLASLTDILDRRFDKTTKQAGATPFPVTAADLTAMIERVGRPMRLSELQRVYELWMEAAGRARFEAAPPPEVPSVPSARLRARVRAWWDAQPPRLQQWLSARGFGEPGPVRGKKDAVARLEAAGDLARLTPQRWGQLERQGFEGLRSAFADLEADEFAEVCRVLGELVPPWSGASGPAVAAST